MFLMLLNSKLLIVI